MCIGVDLIQIGLHGTATPGSDTDIKAVYIPSVRDILLQRVSPAVSESRPKPRGEKNTSADTDCEAFSLQCYLDRLAEVQTVALDMLFALDWAMLEPPMRYGGKSKRWLRNSIAKTGIAVRQDCITALHYSLGGFTNRLSQIKNELYSG